MLTDQKAATAPLLARIDELEKDCDRLERYWNEAMATHKNIAELEAALEEARKDAERHRNLRRKDMAERIPQHKGET